MRVLVANLAYMLPRLYSSVSITKYSMPKLNSWSFPTTIMKAVPTTGCLFQLHPFRCSDQNKSPLTSLPYPMSNLSENHVFFSYSDYHNFSPPPLLLTWFKYSTSNIWIIVKTTKLPPPSPVFTSLQLFPTEQPKRSFGNMSYQATSLLQTCNGSLLHSSKNQNLYSGLQDPSLPVPFNFLNSLPHQYHLAPAAQVSLMFFEWQGPPWLWRFCFSFSLHLECSTLEINLLNSLPFSSVLVSFSQWDVPQIILFNTVPVSFSISLAHYPFSFFPFHLSSLIYRTTYFFHVVHYLSHHKSPTDINSRILVLFPDVQWACNRNRAGTQIFPCTNNDLLISCCCC